MLGNARVRAVQRLISRDMGAHPVVTVRKSLKPAITVGDADIKPGIKKNQNWMYAGGVIQRHPSLYINGTEYYDPKELPQKLPRRKHETNLFITINTNKSLQAAVAHDAQDALRQAMNHLAKEAVICSYLVFGPKSAEYKDDKYVDVIEKVQFQAGIETGEELNRLHAHVWLTIHHYSQVQVSSRQIQALVLEEYNRAAPPSMRIRGLPYVSVKLLPQSNFTEIMKNYMHKAALGN